MNKSPQRIRTKGFTLIELLTVIAIIAILASLLFPTIKGALMRAEITQAKNDMKIIETGIRAYYAEYGKLPVQDSEQGGVGANKCDGYYGTGGGGSQGDTSIYQYEIINILRAISDPTINVNNKYNPKQTPFLEAPSRKGAIAGDGTFIDPWGHPYYIKLDNTYNNLIEYFSNGSANPCDGSRNAVAGPGPISSLAIVISYGPSGVQTNPFTYPNGNIVSFQ